MNYQEGKTKVEVEFSEQEMKAVVNRCKEKGMSIHQLLTDEIQSINA